jgi:hypothetical protein
MGGVFIKQKWSTLDMKNPKSFVVDSVAPRRKRSATRAA